MFLDGDGLQVLDETECRARLRTAPAPVGRLAFVQDGYPVVLPVNFIVLHGEVVFRTGLGSKLDTALRRAPISFEVDALDADLQNGWSVLINGKAEELTGQDLHLAAQRLRAWGPGSKPRFMRIRADRITGRQIG